MRATTPCARGDGFLGASRRRRRAVSDNRTGAARGGARAPRSDDGEDVVASCVRRACGVSGCLYPATRSGR